MRANENAETIPQRYYKMGEWLEVEDGYLIDEVIEQNMGYAFRVNAAEIMTPQEFISKFAQKDASSFVVPDCNKKSVLALSITIKNDGNSTGGIESFMWDCIASTNDWDCRVDDELFALVENSGQRFRIKDGSEYTTIFPFTCQVQPPYLSIVDGDMYPRGTIKGSQFELSFTRRPIEKTVRIKVGKIPSTA